jgi:hypothetical protein
MDRPDRLRGGLGSSHRANRFRSPDGSRGDFRVRGDHRPLRGVEVLPLSVSHCPVVTGPGGRSCQQSLDTGAAVSHLGMYRAVSHGTGGAADLARGRRLYACPRSGRLPRSASSARWSRREGSPCQIRRGSVTSSGSSGPASLPFAPADRASEASCAGAERERGCAVPSRRRERPLGAALKPYRKFSQGPGGHFVRLRLMCDTVASLDARHSRNASGVERGRAEIPGSA